MSDTPIAIEVNCETGEVTERPQTAQEIIEAEARTAAAIAEREEREAAEAAKVIAKASAESKLSALGLTLEEIAALSK